MTAQFPIPNSSLLFAPLAALTLAGCSIAQPPVVTHRAPLSNAIGDVEMAAEPADSGLRADFASSLSEAFAARNIASKTGSRWVADFAVSSHPANTSVVPVGQEEEGVIPSSESGLKARWYHKCKPERVRGSLAVFDRNANALVAKSEGHFIACPGDRAEMNALAALLVQSVTNDGAIGTAQE